MSKTTDRFSDRSMMNRRDFLTTASAAFASSMIFHKRTEAREIEKDIAYYSAHRRTLELPQGKISYIDRGKGKVALFLHGFPLNGYQWRGSVERLHHIRRCIAVDLMGLGYSEIHEGIEISPASQVEMLANFLDQISVTEVDLIANDSGGLLAQIFVAKFPMRVRSLLISNCDVDTNNPPQKFLPAVSLAKRQLFAEKYVRPQLDSLPLARSTKGIGASFTYPERLAQSTIDYYFRPLVSSPLRIRQLDEFTVSMGTKVLSDLRERLRGWHGPVRIIWGAKDIFFDVRWAQWLSDNLPGAGSPLILKDANLFFPEEMPDVISNEARALWTRGKREYDRDIKRWKVGQRIDRAP